MRFLKYSFVTLLIAFLASSAQADLLDGLDAYWPMDGNLEDVAGDMGSTANDFDDDGTIVGAAGSVSFGAGKIGQAGIFDGEDGYVAVPDSVDLAKGGQDLSISAWFRVDAFDTSWQALLGKGEGQNYRVARQGGEDGMAFVGGTGDITGGGPVADGAWHHFAGTTVNGGVSNMYIDGVLAGTNAGPAGITDTNSSTPPALWIGNNAGAAGREWEGGIDELAIWNRALTEGEIGFLARGGQVPEPATVSMLLFGVLGLLGLRRRAH